MQTNNPYSFYAYDYDYGCTPIMVVSPIQYIRHCKKIKIRFIYSV